jgi:cytochrome P450
MWQNMLSMPPEQVESNSLIRALLDYSRQPGVAAVDVKAEIFLFLVAGHETVSHSLSWFFMLLAAHPSAQLECQQAIDEQMADGEDAAGGALLPPFVEAVLKESMRLFPTAGGSTRVVGKSPMTLCVRKSPTSSSGKEEETKEEEEVIVLPKGTYCNVNFYSLHRNKSIWGSDADEFNPSRWLGRNDAMDSSNVFEGAGGKPGELWFAPFSYGHRGCIGRTFALLEMRIFITKMLKQYSFAFADPAFSIKGQDVVVEKLTARPAKSLPLLLTPRR